MVTRRAALIALAVVASLAAAWHMLRYSGQTASTAKTSAAPATTRPELPAKNDSRLSVLAFHGDARDEHREIRQFRPAPSEGPNTSRSFRPPESKPARPPAIAGSCSDLDLEHFTRQNADFRAGLTELNETKENANKISLSRISWRLSCQQAVLLTEGEVQHPQYGSFAIQLAHAERDGFPLTSIRATRAPDSDQQVAMTAIELRANEQRRGQPLSQGIEIEKSAAIRYDSSSISDQSAREVSNLYHNSEWLDLGLRRGTRKLLLSVELPVLRKPLNPLQ